MKGLLNKSGMSRTDFADRVNISKQLLYKYENDIVTNIPSDTLEEMCRVLRVSPSYIMGWEDIDGHDLFQVTFDDIFPDWLKEDSPTAASVSSIDSKKNWLNHLYDELDPKHREALLTRADELYKLQQLDKHEKDVERLSFTASDAEGIA